MSMIILICVLIYYMTKKEDEALKNAKERDKYHELFSQQVEENKRLMSQIDEKTDSELLSEICSLGEKRVEKLLECSSGLAYEYWAEISNPDNSQYGGLDLAATDEEIIKAIDLYEKTTYGNDDVD